MTLTLKQQTNLLENSKPLFLHALQLMIMHHNTKFGNNMFSSLEDIIWTNMDIFALCCDIDPECSDPFFFFFKRHSGYDDVSLDQVWLPRNQKFRRYSRKSHILITRVMAVTLTLKTAINFPPHYTLAHDAASPYCIW